MKKYNKPALSLIKLDSTEILAGSPTTYSEVGDKTQWHSKKIWYDDEDEDYE